MKRIIVFGILLVLLFSLLSSQCKDRWQGYEEVASFNGDEVRSEVSFG